MKYPSVYLDWYVHMPHVRHDLRSSGLAELKFSVNLGEVDLSANYDHGNPETSGVMAKRYGVRPENVFISSEGASGQNARIIRYLEERNPKKNEAIVEYPTYEPLLRQTQNHFRHVKRLTRKESEIFRLDAEALRKLVSEKTGLLVLTNPHAPSGALSDAKELEEIMSIAGEYGFPVLCDEIYAEFDRNAAPTVFSVDPDHGIVTTGFTKAYGLGGLKLGVALAGKELVDELYADVLNTVGNSPNVVQLLATELIGRNIDVLEKHKQKWTPLKRETEEWLGAQGFEFWPNRFGVTYWVRMPMTDTYKWINEYAVPCCNVAPVPGVFFLFKSGYELARSSMVRIGIGNVDPSRGNMTETLEMLGQAISSYHHSA